MLVTKTLKWTSLMSEDSAHSALVLPWHKSDPYATPLQSLVQPSAATLIRDSLIQTNRYFGTSRIHPSPKAASILFEVPISESQVKKTR